MGLDSQHFWNSNWIYRSRCFSKLLPWIPTKAIGVYIYFSMMWLQKASRDWRWVADTPNPCEQRRGIYLVAFLSNEFCCWSCFNNIKAMALFNTIDVMPDPVIQSCRWPFLLTWVSCSFLNWLSVGLVGRHSGQCFEWHDFLWFGTMRRSIFNLLLWGWLKAEHFRFWHTFRGDWWLMDREGNEGDSAEESIGNTFMPGSNNGSIQ